MIKIHSDAAKNFNLKASDLLKKVKGGKPPESTQASFHPEVYIKGTITEKDIVGDISSGMVNGFGNKVAYFFQMNGQEVGIYNEDYKQVSILSEKIFQQKSISRYCSLETIKKLLCEWIKQKYSDPTFFDFYNYLEKEINQSIKQFNVLIPITELSIQKTFKIGKIIFKPIIKELINSWELQLLQRYQDKEADVKNLISKEFRPFQGYTAATISINAESERAKEIAYEETNKALNMLRIFSIAALHPKAYSPCAIWGSTFIDQTRIILFDAEEFHSLNKAIVGFPQRPEILDIEKIKSNYEMGLGIIDKLLDSDSLTPFAQDVLDALTIYSRCTISKNITDKLIYILVSLESIFIRDSSEPIRQNLSERIALFTGKSIEERKVIIKIVRTAYDLRTSFVHHGATIDDFETMENFMLRAWVTITSLIEVTPNFRIREEFLDAIDNKKLL